MFLVSGTLPLEKFSNSSFIISFIFYYNFYPKLTQHKSWAWDIDCKGKNQKSKLKKMKTICNQFKSLYFHYLNHPQKVF